MASSPSGPQEQNGSSKTSETSEFPQFDVAIDDSDHNFTSDPLVASGSNFAKAVMKEWKILQENLPPSIYVRVYEKRMELLRAVIIGPAGTPYHDGLFFFDIAFPCDYPNSPPKVHYRSCGHSLNPNLYSNGKVCLSILNTWPGMECEKWVPDKSSILQVLVSLQGLVLNEKPYYNEPWFMLCNWRTYNDMAFSLSCKTMLCLLRNPPKGFESFVRKHFFDRSRNILTACQVYLNGFLRAGQYQDSATFPDDRVKVGVFLKTLLIEPYGGLEAEFRKNDPSLDGYLRDLNQMVKRKKKEYELREKENQPLKKMCGIVQKTVHLVINWASCSSGVSKKNS